MCYISFSPGHHSLGFALLSEHQLTFQEGNSQFPRKIALVSEEIFSFFLPSWKTLEG